MMSNFSPDQYDVSVQKIMEDGEVMYRAKIREFPHLIQYSGTPGGAYDQAINILGFLLDDMRSKGKSIPAPVVAQDEWSGRITVRTPKTLHRLLAENAELEAISLNQYMLSILSQGVGRIYENGVTMRDGWRRANVFELPEKMNAAAVVDTNQAVPQLRLIESGNNWNTRRV